MLPLRSSEILYFEACGAVESDAQRRSAMPCTSRSQRTSSAGAGRRRADRRRERVEHRRLEHDPGDAPAVEARPERARRVGVVEQRPSSSTSGANACAASFGMRREQLLGELHQRGRAARSAGSPGARAAGTCGSTRRRTSWSRSSGSSCLGDDVLEVRGGALDRLLEQREQQLVLARRSTGRRCAATGPERSTTSCTVKSVGVRVHQLAGGVEEELHPVLGARPRRVERTGDRELPAGRGRRRRRRPPVPRWCS